MSVPILKDPTADLLAQGPVDKGEANKIANKMVEGAKAIGEAEKNDFDDSSDDSNIMEEFESAKTGVFKNVLGKDNDKAKEDNNSDKEAKSTEQNRETDNVDGTGSEHTEDPAEPITAKNARKFKEQDEKSDWQFKKKDPVDVKLESAPKEDSGQLDPVDAVLQPYKKRMSNDAYQKVSSEIKHREDRIKLLEAEKTEIINKRNESGIPDSWYEHPDAFRLLPQYKNAESLIGQITPLAPHYRKELAKIRAGATEWTDLVEDAQGRIIHVKRTLSSPDDSANADVDLTERIQQCNMHLNQLNNQVQGLEYTHKQNLGNYNNKFKGLEDQMFPHYKDESKLKDNQAYQTIVKGFGASANTPAARMLAKLYVDYTALSERYDTLSKQKGVIPTSNVKMINGPGSRDLNKTKTSTVARKSAEDIDMDLFEKAKEGRI